MKVLALTVLTLLPLASAADAGAWNRPRGAGFLSFSIDYFTTAPDAAPGQTFNRAAAQTYVEYGLTETLTLGGKLRGDVRIGGDAAGETASEAAVFLQYRLWQGQTGGVASVRGGVSGPLREALGRTGGGREDGVALTGALQYGRGFETASGGGWFDSALSFATYTGARADAVTLDLTLGYRPAEAWMVIGQVFGSASLRNGDPGGSDFDKITAKASVGRGLFGDANLLLGVSRDVATRGLDPGFEISLAVWTAF